jgi:hypothetical protein
LTGGLLQQFPAPADDRQRRLQLNGGEARDRCLRIGHRRSRGIEEAL